ncbi:TIGR02569 family protein [Corynebacterium epidermidicanis]|uniref:TIGR02569 family protein n=1 Tax=Corynebacterium epidermidicanis TaxID=1050174 RepID=A0A0G3GUJ8_9CORY|nr:TIGR02569 family protein [Corynebacterium epidermidicanis]AKK02557.1 hypothetical protein CEPID_03385 [Corynebacterium epidermidicanis]
MDTLPDHVRAAFHVPTGEVVNLGRAWDNGWRVGNTVLMPAQQPDVASFAAKLREQLKPSHVRLARPVRATDGRYVVSGWRASIFEPGQLQAGRVDETVVAALRLADALAGEKIPSFVQSAISKAWEEHQVFAVADRAAWSNDPEQILSLGLDGTQVASPAVESALKLAARLLPLVPPISAPDQLSHADMLATTIYVGSQDPVVTELAPVAHPHGYTAALTMVDGLLADAVDGGIINRFGHIPDLMGLLLRALLYRTFVHCLLKEANPEMSSRLQSVSDLIIRG